jgi:citrate lyase subunit beta/citryl-CoA lyase
VVHEVFAPKQEEVDYALQVVDAIQRGHGNRDLLGGKMVDAPVVKRACAS